MTATPSIRPDERGDAPSALAEGSALAAVSSTVPIAIQPPAELAFVAPPSTGESAAPTRGGLPVWGWWAIGFATVGIASALVQFSSGMTDRGFYLPVGGFVLALMAAVFDAGTRRIPNVLTYPALLFGLGIHAIVVPIFALIDADTQIVWLGTKGARDGLLGFALCAIIGIVSLSAGGMGGGDVKLLAALGAVMGLAAIIPVLFNALAIGALVGIVNWLLRGEPVRALQRVSLRALLLATDHPVPAGQPIYKFKHNEAPFCLSVFLGVLTAPFFSVLSWVLGILPDPSRLGAGAAP